MKGIIFGALIILYMATCSCVIAQKTDTLLTPTALGISFQIYPAGLISCITYENYFSKNASLVFRLGYNYADRKDFSPYNDNEKGSGFGGSTGYRKHFQLKKGKIVLGLNCDIWNMWINWQNDIGEPNYTKGQSYTLVVQPWVEGGYFIYSKSNSIQFGITTGFGREINVITDGKDVGQGWMNSILIHVNYVFRKT